MMSDVMLAQVSNPRHEMELPDKIGNLESVGIIFRGEFCRISPGLIWCLSVRCWKFIIYFYIPALSTCIYKVVFFRYLFGMVGTLVFSNLVYHLTCQVCNTIVTVIKYRYFSPSAALSPSNQLFLAFWFATSLLHPNTTALITLSCSCMFSQIELFR